MFVNVIKSLFVGIVAIMVCISCVAAPFATSNPTKHPESDVQVVSICYHAGTTTREQIMLAASENCEIEGSILQFWRHDRMLNECPILAKTRVSFLCTAPIN